MTIPSNIHIEKFGVTQSYIYVRQSGTNSSCNFFVTFSNGHRSSGQRELRFEDHRQPYELYKDATKTTRLRDIPQAAINEVIQQRLIPQQKILSVPFFIYLPKGDLARAGRYRDQVEVTVYEGAPDSKNKILQRKTLNLSFYLPEEVQLSLVESGAAFSPNDVDQYLNFGVLSKGKRKSFDVVIKSNTDFDMFFRSENNGRLKHEKHGSYVDYDFWLNQEKLRLSSKIKKSQSFLGNAKGIYRNTVQVVIGEVRDKISGLYEDDIIVTVEAR